MPGYLKGARTKPVFKIAAIDDQEKFQPLPLPTGKYPYHLNIEKILPSMPAGKMVFHVAGDTGGLVSPVFKHQVANEMIKQCTGAIREEDRPQFFFHLGDVVYNFGQAAEYYPQFFEPYKNYPAPIFAIPGNHDGDVNPSDPEKPKSLDAFVNVFCGVEPKPVGFAGDTGRKSNIQPNVYYTLKTPLANIVSLYSNVPRFGTITQVQKQWFINELKNCGAEKGEKALIVCLHHSPYSADTNHGSSLPMQLFLKSAFDTAGVLPDIVFSGHVHNYQRFTSQYPDKKTVPYIVAGAGGYAELHKIAEPGDPSFPDDSMQFDGVRLENYCDHTHGFLKISLEKTSEGFKLKGEYFIIWGINEYKLNCRLYDSFTLNIGERISQK